MKRKLIMVMAVLLIGTIVASSCGNPRDYHGNRKRKIGMGWM